MPVEIAGGHVVSIGFTSPGLRATARIEENPPMPPAGFTIRVFHDGDAPSVTAVWHACFHDHSAWRAPEAILARRAQRQRELFFVAELEGTVVGTVLGGYDGHRGWIYRLAVLPIVQRRGVGRALVAAVEERLQQLDCPKINLQVEGGNDVVGFYQRLGFSIEDRVSFPLIAA